MQAMNYAEFEMLGDWRLIDKYLEGLRKVKPGDVKRVANKLKDKKIILNLSH